MDNRKIITLGGGIGTVNLIKGLKDYFSDVTVVVSMADEGGSSGRLRRLYDIFPPGDLVSCMAALTDKKDHFLAKLLTYRFPGDRYAKDEHLAGHKLGNLLLVAMRDMTGDFSEAIGIFQKMFKIGGKFYPATHDQVSISAKTREGKEIIGEEKIDLGRYRGKRILDHVFLHPKNAKANKNALQSIKRADVIIVGPGDLYTTLLPVMIVPGIAKALKESRAKKVFVVNVANKPFETKGYNLMDYARAVEKHIGTFPFQVMIANNNFHVVIPKKYKYHYVPVPKKPLITPYKVVMKDLVDDNFPLYHSPQKLAKAIVSHI